MNRLLPRPSVLAALLFLGFAVSPVAHAQAAEDGGVSLPAPDASVGGGGADRDNEENEPGVGRVPVKCRNSGECAPRFTCSGGRCQYTGIREAERVGCLLGPEAAVVLVGLGVVAAWRRRRR